MITWLCHSSSKQDRVYERARPIYHNSNSCRKVACLIFNQKSNAQFLPLMLQQVAGKGYMILKQLRQLSDYSYQGSQWPFELNFSVDVSILSETYAFKLSTSFLEDIQLVCLWTDTKDNLQCFVISPVALSGIRQTYIRFLIPPNEPKDPALQRSYTQHTARWTSAFGSC